MRYRGHWHGHPRARLARRPLAPFGRTSGRPTRSRSKALTARSRGPGVERLRPAAPQRSRERRPLRIGPPGSDQSVCHRTGGCRLAHPLDRSASRVAGGAVHADAMTRGPSAGFAHTEQEVPRVGCESGPGARMKLARRGAASALNVNPVGWIDSQCVKPITPLRAIPGTAEGWRRFRAHRGGRATGVLRGLPGGGGVSRAPWSGLSQPVGAAYK